MKILKVRLMACLNFIKWLSCFFYHLKFGGLPIVLITKTKFTGIKEAYKHPDEIKKNA
ncbi:hypothetical protein [Mucilaginibacter sp.]|uniref:hypothetical protein n=1 Tax=Mucilaginibacter sp. TaxID=1882438 RepID=UPI003AFFCC99